MNDYPVFEKRMRELAKRNASGRTLDATAQTVASGPTPEEAGG